VVELPSAKRHLPNTSGHPRFESTWCRAHEVAAMQENIRWLLTSHLFSTKNIEKYDGHLGSPITWDVNTVCSIHSSSPFGSLKSTAQVSSSSWMKPKPRSESHFCRMPAVRFGALRRFLGTCSACVGLRGQASTGRSHSKLRTLPLPLSLARVHFGMPSRVGLSLECPKL